MSNILSETFRWLRHDLELEHLLQVQDLRLIRMGFSHDEVMDMTLADRSSYLQLGSNVQRIEEYEKAMLNVEVGTLSSGFSDKKTRKRVYKRWDRTIRTASNDLEFNMPIAGDRTDASASKHSAVKKPGVRTFKQKLADMAKKRESRT